MGLFLPIFSGNNSSIESLKHSNAKFHIENLNPFVCMWRSVYALTIENEKKAEVARTLDRYSTLCPARILPYIFSADRFSGGVCFGWQNISHGRVRHHYHLGSNVFVVPPSHWSCAIDENKAAQWRWALAATVAYCSHTRNDSKL